MQDYDKKGNPIPASADSNVEYDKDGNPITPKRTQTAERPSAASRYSSALWHGINPIEGVKNLVSMAMHPGTTAEGLTNAAVSHAVNALDSGYKALSPSSGSTDRISEGLNAMRQAVGTLLPGTVERGNRGMGMNPQGTQASYERKVEGPGMPQGPRTDWAGATGDQTAFTANLFAPEIVKGLVKLLPTKQAATSLAQTAGNMENPAQAERLLVKGEMPLTVQGTGRLDRSVPDVQLPMDTPSPLVDQFGKPLPSVLTRTAKDPSSLADVAAHRTAVQRPAASVWHEGIPAELGYQVAGRPGAAVGAAVGLATRPTPLSWFAQKMYNAGHLEHPTLAQAIRAALLAKMADPNQGGS